jgi:hypothetical protein
MKRALLTTIAVSALLAPAATAHNNNYAFQAREVRIKQNNLRYLFNSLPAFEDWGPHVVRCRGLNPVTMRDGSRGYRHIRCVVETMNVPDFIYHINANGKVFTTRAWS